MPKAKILAIDDDVNLQMVVRTYLEDDDYNVITASNINEAITKNEENEFDVVLLDLGLPDGEGMALIPQLRSNSKAAVIVVSGKSDTTEKIVCLEMGADDYLTKPYEMRELTARIKAVLRRVNDADTNPVENLEENKPSKIEFMSWILDANQYQLFDKDGKSAELTSGEFELLEILVNSPNRVMTREHLFDLTRPGNFDVYDRAIDIQVARLRKKMAKSNPDLDMSQIIKTVRGVGYMLCLEN